MDPVDEIKKNGKLCTLSKGEVLVQQGAIDQSLYLIETGLLKATYLTYDGHEFIKSFLQEGELIGNLTSCLTGEPSTFSIICLEDTQLIKIPFKQFEKLSKKNSALAQMIIDTLLKIIRKKELREYELLCLDAKSRYENILARHPDIYDRITQNDIARFIGITPVALSRIRNRFFAK